MNSLFGVDLPTPVTVIIAFVIVLVLIGVAAWVVRKFGAARLAAGRGRQPRLAVIDAAAVDGRRKLVIIRRDNVEHLLMIGGPTDVVVETNIMRAAPATQRETSAGRGADTLPRAAPMPEAPAWPPQPEPAVAAARTERPRLLPDEHVPSPPPSTPPTPQPVSPPIAASARLTPEPARAASSIDPLMGLAAELSRSKTEPTARPAEPRATVTLAPSHPPGEAPAAPAAASTAAPIPPDVHLAEMAQRLESALRRPLAQKAESARPSGVSDPKRSEKAAAPVHPSVNGNGAQAKTAYENLEQEMASLLGRQAGKT